MKTIGRYAILGLLGRGGMGAVYKAAMPRTGRVVAIKVLKPAEQLAATADLGALRRGFFREAALMAGIRHPNIAQVLDVDEAPSPDGGSAGGAGGGLPFFVLEYYCNNLGALLGEGYRVEAPARRLGVEQSLSCARQLASALARLHHAGIVHRDIKPFNLMLAERPPDACLPQASQTGLGQANAVLTDEVKLIDFGLSRLRGEKSPALPRGAVVGSPYYAAPEQERDPETADERADVFAASVTLFRCLTGRLPQEGAPASALRAGLDKRFDAFFASACHQDRNQRPASARALLAELDGLSAHWARLREQACALPEEHRPPCAQDAAQHTPRTLRSGPVHQPLKGARDFFGLDELWRPAACDPERFVEAGPGLVHDLRTGLVWERGGSPYGLTFAAAQARAGRLAAESRAGFSGWRLPTVQELSTLLLPEPDLRQLCLPPAFGPDQRRIWSADRKSFSAAWYADVEHGFVWWQDATCEFFARCVTPEG
ncbi:MAG: serine/threonine protein kinase [Desulfovibrio sp.]|nr:serine/threonine protein kinase [Desulfovibrio sp.]